MLLYLYDRVHGRRVFVRAADDSGSESDFDDEWEAIDRGPESSRGVCVCVSWSRAPTIPVSRGIDEVGQRGAERKRGWVRSRRAGTQLVSALNMSYVVQPVSQRSVWLAGRERSSGH